MPIPFSRRVDTRFGGLLRHHRSGYPRDLGSAHEVGSCECRQLASARIGHRESAHCGRSVGGHGNLHGIRALCLTPVWLACPPRRAGDWRIARHRRGNCPGTGGARGEADGVRTRSRRACTARRRNQIERRPSRGRPGGRHRRERRQALQRTPKRIRPSRADGGFAGGDGAPRPLLHEDAVSWRRTLDANLTSAFLTLKTFLPSMCERGRGAVVTMASAAGRQLSGASAPYAAAKAGLLSLPTGRARSRVKASGSMRRASAIVTDRLAAQPLEIRQAIAQGFPLKRLGTVTM